MTVIIIGDIKINKFDYALFKELNNQPLNIQELSKKLNAKESEIRDSLKRLELLHIIVKET